MRRRDDVARAERVDHRDRCGRSRRHHRLGRQCRRPGGRAKPVEVRRLHAGERDRVERASGGGRAPADHDAVGGRAQRRRRDAGVRRAGRGDLVGDGCDVGVRRRTAERGEELARRRRCPARRARARPASGRASMTRPSRFVVVPSRSWATLVGEDHRRVLERGPAVAADDDDVRRRGERRGGELEVRGVGERVAAEEDDRTLQARGEGAELRDVSRPSLRGRTAPAGLEPRASRRRGARARAAGRARAPGRSRRRRCRGEGRRGTVPSAARAAS